MARHPNHPISKCPALAKAYESSRLHDTIMDMLFHVQRALEAAKKQRITHDASSGFNVQQMSQLKNVSTNVPHCGPGMTAQFFKRTGQPAPNDYVPVPEEEALVVRDGNLELSSHVAREKIECVPRITVAQITGKQTRDNLQYRPVLVPGVDQQAPAEPRVDYSGIKEFTTGRTEHDLYGAAMAAYVVPETLSN